MTSIESYESLYLHDSSIKHINLDVWERICILHLTHAGILKESAEMFNYEVFYKPAILTFIDVKEINYPEGYGMKTEILSQEAKLADELPGYYCYSLNLAEGNNLNTFTTTITIIAKDFSLSGLVSQPHPRE
ncbi:MAG: hypothetical protein QM758_27545 [Armatimonas sp.]